MLSLQWILQTGWVRSEKKIDSISKWGKWISVLYAFKLAMQNKTNDGVRDILM